MSCDVEPPTQRLDSVGESTTTASCSRATSSTTATPPRRAHRLLRRDLARAVAGFDGLRDADGQVRGQLIEFDMTHPATRYCLVEGSGILIDHDGEELRLTTAAAIRRPVMHELPRAA